MPALRPLVAVADSNASSSTLSSRPAKRDRPSRITRQRSSASPVATKLVVAIAPGLTIGLVRPPGPLSMAVTELKGKPVPLTPISSRILSPPCAVQARAKTNGFETLMMVNGTPASPADVSRPSTLATLIPKRSRGIRASAG